MVDGTGRADVLDRLAGQLLDRERAHPLRVAVDGVSAAGKTTLADELGALVGRLGRPVIRADLDWFKRPRAARTRYPYESADDYYLDTYDYPAVRAALLLPLGPGGSRRYRTAVVDQPARSPVDAPELTAPDDAVALVDGVFLLRPELNDCWDFRIFVHIGFDLVLERGGRRDAARVGSPDAARERYLKRYIPGERRYLRAVRPQALADVVVDNSDPAAPLLRT